MISRNSRAIFIHVRKSAGTTVKSLFDDADDTRFALTVNTPDWHEPEFEGFYSFAVVRNPYDRFVSSWKYLPSTRNRTIGDVLCHLPQRTPGGYVFTSQASPAARYRDGLEFLGWQINRFKLGAARRFRNYRGRGATGMHDYLHMTVQQWEFLLDRNGCLPLDRVVFFEHLREGLSEVFSDLGQPMPKVPRLRSTPKRQDYRRHFTQEARSLFEDIFRKDIETWGYDFESGMPRVDTPSITSLDQITQNRQLD